MSEEIIDSYVDRQGVASDTDFLEAELKKVVDMFDKVNKMKITLQGSASLKTVAQASEEGFKANERLNQSTKAVINLVKERFATEAKLVTLQTDYAKATAANRVEIQKQNQELKVQAQLQQANTGSIERAQAAVKALTKERNQLNLYTKEGQERQAQLNAQIDKYNNFIKKNVDQLAAQKINVGNYSGAISVLKTSLEDVSRKIDQYNKSGKVNSDVLKALEKEQQILNQLVNNQAAGFANATAEIKENQKALLQMEQAGLSGTQAFEQLSKTTAELKDQVSDLKARTKTLGSDSFVFDSLIQGAQVLAGAYGAAQGAAALFGDENEELQKTFVKLQATMTVIQGLQSVVNGLQKESAFILGIQSAREKALLGFQALRNFVLRGQITATRAATIETNANTAATVATTGATVAATAAMRVFRFALIATGIGAVLVLLTSAASAMSNFGDETKDATEDLDAFNNRLEFTRELLNSNVENLRFEGKIRAEQAKQRGADDTELTRLEIENLKKQKQAFLDNAKIRQEEFDKEVSKTKGFNGEKAKALADEVAASKAAARGIDKEIIVKNEEAKTRAYEKTAAARKKLDDEARKRAEEYAKRERDAQLEILRLGMQDMANYYKEIADDETKSFEQRITALTKYTAQTAALINFENELIQRSADKTPQEKELSESKTVIALRDLKIDSEKKYQAIVTLDFERRKEQGRKELEEFRAREEQKRQIAQNLLDDKTAKEELATMRQFEIDSAGVSAEKRLELEQKLQEEITKIREKAALAALILEENELKRKRVILQLFKQDTSTIDLLITQNEIAQSNLRIANTKRELTEKEKLRNKALDTALLIEQQATELISAIVSGQNTREKNRLQDEIDAIEKRKQAELAANDARVQSDQDRAANATAINIRAQAQREELEQRQRKLDIQRAKFERDMGILQIIVQIGVAIAKQQYAAAALAGVALAKALATPLPGFYKGKSRGQAYEGPALVNDHPDGRTTEVIERADGTLEFPQGRNVVTHVGKNDIVHPDKDRWMAAILGAAHRDAAGGMVMPSQKKEDVVGSQLAIQTRLLKQIAGKKELTLGATDRGMVALWNYGATSTRYIDENTNW